MLTADELVLVACGGILLIAGYLAAHGSVGILIATALSAFAGWHLSKYERKRG